MADFYSTKLTIAAATPGFLVGFPLAFSVHLVLKCLCRTERYERGKGRREYFQCRTLGSISRMEGRSSSQSWFIIQANAGWTLANEPRDLQGKASKLTSARISPRANPCLANLTGSNRPRKPAKGVIDAARMEVDGLKGSYIPRLLSVSPIQTPFLGPCSRIQEVIDGHQLF